LTFIERVKANAIVEIGVSAGTSTLMMLKFFETTKISPRLYSFDIAEKYVEDQTRDVAWLVRENYPVLPANWSLHTGKISADVLDTISLAGGPMPELVYLDAHHGQPWPILDCFVCLSFCKPGTWIVLHDINLPRMMPEFQNWGAVHLFDGWTGEKCSDVGNPLPYAGAIRLSDDRDRDIENLFAILGLRWEVEIWHGHAERILKATSQYLNGLQQARLAAAFSHQ
jgi:hypothetical protein